VSLTDQQRAFLEHNHGAAMITLRPDGTANAVRVGVALLDGLVWSSGTQARRRTAWMAAEQRLIYQFDPLRAYGMQS
jgi:hypothetical protein